VLLLFVVLLTITVYLILGYYVILAPGRVYNTLIAMDWTAFHGELREFSLLLFATISVRTFRGFLTDCLANTLRRRLALRVHGAYLAYSDTDTTAILRAVRGGKLDNPDQRAVADVRDFCDSFCALAAGKPSTASAGALEAFVTVAWYSFQVAARAGVRAVVLAYLWSALAVALGACAVSISARAHAKSEASEARLRYGHGALRTSARSIAFEGAHTWRRTHLDAVLRSAVKARWNVIRTNIPVALIDHSFAYCVSIVMYTAIAVAIATVQAEFFQKLTAGEKAQWVSQTGGVFMQLLYAFTMVVSLGPQLSAFVAQTHRVHALLDVLNSPPTGTADTTVHTKGPVPRNTEESDCIVMDALRVALPDGRITSPLTLRVSPGERVLVCGRSGVGKTTALFALRGLIPSHSGYSNVPSGTAFVAQNCAIPPDVCSLRELVLYPNIPVGGSVESTSIREALSAVGWARVLDDVDDEREWGIILSPGERQLLTVAGLLVRVPKVKFAVLDEPTSALDKDAETRCMNALVAAGIAILTVSHSENLRAAHDRVITLTEPTASTAVRF